MTTERKKAYSPGEGISSAQEDGMTGATATPGRTYTVGTLVYTPGGLVALFGWLLWGDFIFTMMETVMPSLLPLLLKSHGASNQAIITIVSTIYMVMNAVLNPIISFKSDRFRSRWGRRRPFIIATTPMVVLFLAAIPFASGILRWVSSIGLIAKLFSMGPVAPIILMFGGLVAGYQIFNMFIASVYYYLIPDVVPGDHIGRFYGLFRVFGNLAGMVFNYFIFGLAESHMRMIFVVIAMVYGFFILLMCWRVKEGEYPPPLTEEHDHWWSGIQNYVRECFGHSYYWWVFLAYSSALWAGASGVFAVFFYRDEMGFTLDFIGKIKASSGLLAMVIVYPCGIIVDRWGCHKTLILGRALIVFCSIVMFFFIRDRWSAFGLVLLEAVPMNLAALALMKWVVEVYPQDRYGQFSSAGALCASLGGIILGPVCGWLMDWIGNFRYFMIWNIFFSIVSVFAAMVVYRQWKILGGPDEYRAP